MLAEASFQGPRKSDEDQRHNYYRQHRVRQQNGEVNGSHRALSLKLHGTDVEVINQVGSQKQRRRDKRADHAKTVSVSIFLFDENVTGHQQDGADAIQNCVECRKV